MWRVSPMRRDLIGWAEIALLLAHAVLVIIKFRG
jgi:hypothetical protein